MSRLPENKEYQQHQQQKSPRGGDDPGAADGDTARKSVNSGAAADDSQDFGALYANVSGQPLGDYPADEHRTAAMHLASAVEQMRDKNLSGVVRTIQDEGPPGYEEDSRVAADTAWQDEVAPGNSGLATFSEGYESEPDTGSAWINSLSRQGLSSSKLAFFGLLLAIMVILVVIGALGGNGKDVSSPAELNRVPVEETQPVASTLAGQATDTRLREIQEIQLQINVRLDKLESDIAALAEDNSRQWVANEAVLGAMRGQQHSEQALVASSIDALQKQVAALPVAAALPEVSADSPVVAVTEVSAGSSVTSSAPKPVMQPGGDGDWTVNLASFSREEQAGKLLGTLKRAGIQAEQQTTSLNGNTRYRLRVTGFSSRDEAKRYADKLDKGLGLGDPWVSHR